MRKLLKVFTTLMLTLALLIPAALAEYAAIGHTTDNLRLRSEASLSSKVLTTATKGAAIIITEKDPVVNGDGTWYAVLYNGQAGYMSADYLDIQNDGEAISEIGYISDSYVNFRSEPNTDSEKLGVFDKNTKVEIIGIEDGWYAVRYKEQDGYVRCDLVTLAADGFVPLLSAAPSSSTSANVTKDYSLAVSTLDSADATELQRQIVESALTHLGKTYKYGAAGPNTFDCSGFTSYVYKQFGYSINRSSLDQYRFTGNAVSKSELLPGDLVFFRTTSKNTVTHVGMYIGGGQFVHASSGTGRCIKVSDLNSGYYYERYVGAKRVL